MGILPMMSGAHGQNARATPLPNRGNRCKKLPGNRSKKHGVSNFSIFLHPETRQLSGYLSTDPRDNTLSSREISDLSRAHGLKIFQSHLQNNTPGTGRIF